MKIIFLIILFLINYSTFAYEIKGRVIDDLTHNKVDGALLIINEKDSLFTDINGEFYFKSKDSILHVDVKKLRYKDYHFDLNISNIDYKVVIPIHPLEFHTHEVLINSNKIVDRHKEIFTYNEDVKQINSNMSTSVGETLNSIKGVELRSMGSAPTRPIFRGLGNDRLKINVDGIENNDLSASSPDHNIAIDPQSINEAEILRGPSTLKYSSSSSAGVINLTNDEIPIQEIHNQNLELKNYYHTNNQGVSTFLEYATNTFDLFNLKMKYSKILSDNIETPERTLLNSDINSNNYSIGFGKILNDLEFGANYNFYENNYGIPPGPNGLHSKGVDIEMYKRDLKIIFNYHFHENKYIQDLNINYLYNYLNHSEIESSGLVGARYIIENNILRFDFKGKNILKAEDTDFGFILSYNYFDAGAAVRTPEVSDYSFASYIVQKYEIDNYYLDFAYRNEITNFWPKKDNSVGNNVELFDKSFFINTFSASLFNNINSKNNIGLILSYDERVPTKEELYSMGPHLAAYSYDIGNQNIEKENSINFEFIYQNNIEFNNLKINNNFNIYNYYFLNFITPRNTGKIDLLRTRLPIFENQNLEANLTGFEYELIIGLNKFQIKNLVQYTYGLNIEDNIPLPMIPPLKNYFTVSYNADKWNVSLISETALKQNNIDTFETPTNSYSILNFKSSYFFSLFGFQNQFVFNIRNIFNATYRNHLSRIKDIMPESGINVSIGLNNYL